MTQLMDIIRKVTGYKDFFVIVFGITNIILVVFNYIWIKKLEGYKTELQKNLKENEVKFSKIYTEKANIIKELYSKSWDLEKKLEKFLVKDNKLNNINTTVIDKKFINQTKDIAVDFSYFFNKNRIFLTEELDAILCEINVHIEIFISNINKGLVKFSKESTDVDESLVAEFIDLLPKIREELKTEFKKFLEID